MPERVPEAGEWVWYGRLNTGVEKVLPLPALVVYLSPRGGYCLHLLVHDIDGTTMAQDVPYSDVLKGAFWCFPGKRTPEQQTARLAAVAKWMGQTK